MGPFHDPASGLVPRLVALGGCLLLQMGVGVAGIGSVVEAGFEGRSCRVRSALGIPTHAKAVRSHGVPHAGLRQIELERPKFQTPPESPRHSQPSVTQSRARGERGAFGTRTSAKNAKALRLRRASRWPRKG